MRPTEPQMETPGPAIARKAGSLRILTLPGDGIGPEVMAACLPVIEAALARAGVPPVTFEEHAAGALHYQRTGIDLTQETLRTAEASDAILFGAMGLPSIRRADGTEIAPQIDLRFHFSLYAGVRPIRLLPGVRSPLRDSRAAQIDFVLVRESTEGLFAGLRTRTGHREPGLARDTLEITAPTSRKLFDFAFRLAERRKAAGRPGVLGCVDKANVLQSLAYFRELFTETAARFPGITPAYHYVDALALTMVQGPWSFDVLVTENMFGDILSDLGAALVGGMGMAPSADIGDKAAVFQPSHGSAPDIAGRGIANPTAMVLSAAMMFGWLAETRGEPRFADVARLIEGAVEACFADRRVQPCDLGGTTGTAAMSRAFLAAVGTAL